MADDTADHAAAGRDEDEVVNGDLAKRKRDDDAPAAAPEAVTPDARAADSRSRRSRWEAPASEAMPEAHDASDDPRAGAPHGVYGAGAYGTWDGAEPHQDEAREQLAGYPQQMFLEPQPVYAHVEHRREQVHCPQALVGRLIGKQGETIKDLQRRSGARIQIDQNFPEGHARLVTVEGDAQAVQAAVELVTNLIGNNPSLGSNGAPARMTRFECPKTLVGRVIGKGGETINELQRRSGARIQIEQRVPEGAPCIIEVQGDDGAVAEAIRLTQEVMNGKRLESAPGANQAGPPAGHPGSAMQHPPSYHQMMLAQYPATYGPYTMGPRQMGYAPYYAPPYGSVAYPSHYSGYSAWPVQQYAVQQPQQPQQQPAGANAAANAAGSHIASCFAFHSLVSRSQPARRGSGTPQRWLDQPRRRPGPHLLVRLSRRRAVVVTVARAGTTLSRANRRGTPHPAVDASAVGDSQTAAPRERPAARRVVETMPAVILSSVPPPSSDFACARGPRDFEPEPVDKTRSASSLKYARPQTSAHPACHSRRPPLIRPRPIAPRPNMCFLLLARPACSGQRPRLPPFFEVPR